MSELMKKSRLWGCMLLPLNVAIMIMELVMIIPQKDNMIKGYAMIFVMGCNRAEIQIIPYPPSLSRIAARTIGPAMGASMWAVGSQR